MPRVRVALRSIAAAWLLCQAAAFVLVPVLLDASVTACVCAHGTDGSCPMHHLKAAGARMCAVRSATASDVVVLHSAYNVAGLEPAPRPAIVPARTVHAVPVEWFTLIEHASTPEPLPPRV
jgi:hypothetical protein